MARWRSALRQAQRGVAGIHPADGWIPGEGEVWACEPDTSKSVVLLHGQVLGVFHHLHHVDGRGGRSGWRLRHRIGDDAGCAPYPGEGGEEGGGGEGESEAHCVTPVWKPTTCAKLGRAGF